MPDVFTRAELSDVMSRIRSRDSSKFLEVKIVARQAGVFDNVGHDAARHVTRMPRKGDETVGAERVRLVTVTACRAEKFAADFAQPFFKLPTIPRRIFFPHGSSGENEFVAEGRRNRASRFEQRFEMCFGRLLEAQDRFAAVAPV